MIYFGFYFYGFTWDFIFGFEINIFGVLIWFIV